LLISLLWIRLTYVKATIPIARISVLLATKRTAPCFISLKRRLYILIHFKKEINYGVEFLRYTIKVCCYLNNRFFHILIKKRHLNQHMRWITILLVLSILLSRFDLVVNGSKRSRRRWTRQMKELQKMKEIQQVDNGYDRSPYYMCWNKCVSGDKGTIGQCKESCRDKKKLIKQTENKILLSHTIFLFMQYAIFYSTHRAK